jgi:hypothetical protein
MLVLGTNTRKLEQEQWPNLFILKFWGRDLTPRISATNCHLLPKATTMVLPSNFVLIFYLEVKTLFWPWILLLEVPDTNIQLSFTLWVGEGGD